MMTFTRFRTVVALTAFVLAPLAGLGACGPADVPQAPPAPQAQGIHVVLVQKEGPGGGVVRAPGIDCGADCAEDYPTGSDVVLTATPDADSGFVGWSGACSGAGPCSLRVDSTQTLTARFARKRYRLTINKSGGGGVTVQSAPVGVSCGATCTADFDAGAVVTLSASVDSINRFSGWTGPCGGIGACQVTLNGDVTVGASFSPVGASAFDSAFVSEEGGSPWTSCGANGFAVGAKCRGGDCDDMALVCLSPLLPSEGTRTLSGWFSDELPAIAYSGTGFVSKLHCRGDNCDDIQLEYVTHPRIHLEPTSCLWTGYFSEEAGAGYCPAGRYVAGMGCSGDDCDNVRLWCCAYTLLP